MVTGGNKRLQGIRRGYKGLQPITTGYRVTRGYRVLQELTNVTGVKKGLQGVTKG